MNPELWKHESGFLTDKAKTTIENMSTISDEDLIYIYRELDAVSRLLWGEVYCSQRNISKVALACGVNYSQTPVSQYGYIPPAEISMHLSCVLVEEFEKADRAKLRINNTVDMTDFD